MNVDAKRRPIPGPIDRETFLDAQRRHRRAAALFGAVSLLTIASVGAAVTALFTPTIYLLGAFVLRLANLVAPLDTTRHRLRFALQREVTTIAGWFAHQPVTADAAIRAALVLIAPSVIAVLLLWIVVHRNVRGAADGARLALHAREPNPTTLAERELVDVVSEMAVASGLPPLRVFVVDQAGVNAGVFGTSASDAAIIVSSALPDALDREALEAVIGHLVGSVGNGDLAIGEIVASTIRTIGLVEAVLDAPFHRRARATLFQLAQLVATRNADERARRTGDVARLLAPGLDDDGGTDSGWKALAALPVTVLKFGVVLYGAFLCGPLIALLWRSRRYLADATAVELTRDPDGLVSALSHLSRVDTSIEGVPWLARQFVVAPGRESENADDGSGFGVGWSHPSNERRIKRLQRIGARAPAGTDTRIARPTHRGALIALSGVAALVFGPLFVALFAAVSLLVCVVNYVGALIYLALVLLLLR